MFARALNILRNTDAYKNLQSQYGEDTVNQAMENVSSNFSNVFGGSGISSFSSSGGFMSYIMNLLQSVVAKYADNEMTGGQRERADYEFQLGEQAADNAFGRQEQLIKDQYGLQVQGMKQAGINPALMYGGAVNAPTAPQGTGGSPSGSASGNLLSVLPQLMLMRSQMSLNESLVAKNKAEANATSVRAQNDTSRVKIEQQRLDAYKSNLDEVTRGLKISNDVSEALKEIKILQEKTDLDISEATLAAANLAANEVSERIRLLSAQVDSEVVRKAYLEASSRLASADAKTKTIFNLYADQYYKAQTQ